MAGRTAFRDAVVCRAHQQDTHWGSHSASLLMHLTNTTPRLQKMGLQKGGLQPTLEPGGDVRTDEQLRAIMSCSEFVTF